MAGVAFDAVTRGLKVAMFEREDYAAGTSSRSTKLAHGGLRYLEKAFMNLVRILPPFSTQQKCSFATL